jgi:hypothetical protein
MELQATFGSHGKIFTIFVDTLFTTFKKSPFTKAFSRVAKPQAVLACGVRVSPINSPAT